MASIPEATVRHNIGVFKWILVIKSSWIPELFLRDPCKNGVSSMYAQILVLAVCMVCRC